MSGKWLDVSDLEPPEPLVRTLSAAATLAPGEFLQMRHRRYPCLLPENLERRGFRYLISEREEAVYTLIWRRHDPAAERAAERTAGEGQ